MSEALPVFSSREFSDRGLGDLQRVGIEAVRCVSQVLQANLGASAKLKEPGEPLSLVTDFDLQAQRQITAYLKEADATIGVHGEEEGLTTDTRIFWVVDPIDGTLHYARGDGDRCHTALALVERQTCRLCTDRHEVAVPVVSVIHNFYRDTTYTATATSPSVAINQFGQTTPLHVGSRWEFVECYTDSPRASAKNEDHIRRKTGAFALRHAAAAYSAVCIAEGKLDALIIADNHFTGRQDTAPAALLVAQAGGEAHTAGRACYSCYDLDTDTIGSSVMSNGAVDRAVIDESLQ